MEPVAEERLGEVDDQDAAGPKAGVRGGQRGVEPGDRNRDVDRRGEAVGVDDALRRHGRHDQRDAVAAQAFGRRRQGGDGRVRGGASRAERGDLPGGEEPPVAARHHAGPGGRGFRGQPGAGGAEAFDELRVGRSGAGGGEQRSGDERAVDPHVGGG